MTPEINDDADIIRAVKLIALACQAANESDTKEERIKMLLIGFDLAQQFHDKCLAKDEMVYWDAAVTFEELKINLAQLIRQTEEEGFW